jgi:methylamine dehydrogenase accessory protein MauD
MENGVTLAAFWASYALLWTLVVLLLFVVILVLRQHGDSARASTRIDEQGPTIGERVPPVTLIDLDSSGANGQADEVHALNGPSLVLMVSPTCPACKSLLTSVSEFVASEAANVTVVCSGDVNACGDFLSSLPSSVSRLVDKTRKAGLRWHISLLPSAFAVDADGIVQARGGVRGRAALQRMHDRLVLDPLHEARAERPVLTSHG